MAVEVVEGHGAIDHRSQQGNNIDKGVYRRAGNSARRIPTLLP